MLYRQPQCIKDLWPQPQLQKRLRLLHGWLYKGMPTPKWPIGPPLWAMRREYRDWLLKRFGFPTTPVPALLLSPRAQPWLQLDWLDTFSHLWANVSIETHRTDEYDSLAVFSGGIASHRYFLTRIWNRSKPPLIVLLCNPSTATAFKNDPTVARCIGFARRWGFGGVIVLNVFALRSTDPTALVRHNDPVGLLNPVIIGMTIDRVRAVFKRAVVVAGWGEVARKHDTVAAIDTIKQIVYDKGVNLYAFNVTASGTPKHPLYLKRETVPTLLSRGHHEQPNTKKGQRLKR